MGAYASYPPLVKNKPFNARRSKQKKPSLASHQYCVVNGWSFNTITDWDTRKQAYNLRAQVYDYELKWSSSNYGYEVDMFDEFATHLAVSDPSGKVVATARSLDWGAPWMATECYGSRFSDEVIHLKQRPIHEVSRLCISSTHRYTKIAGGITVLDVFLKGILVFGLERGMTHSYFVTRTGMERAMQKRGFEIPYLSPRHRMPDGCLIRSFLVANQRSHNQFNLSI